MTKSILISPRASSDAIILLLWGGDKSRQSKDIRQAQNYWQDYRSRDNA